MPSGKPLIDDEGEVRELSAADLERFAPAADTLPVSLRHKLGVRGPQRDPTKERVTIRLSREVVAAFRASGAGWQTRIDGALKEWLARRA